MRYLTVALTKGRLANKTMEMFEKAGITCEEMKDKDSRKLIFTNEELKMKFFLAKGPDVPTYVEYGAADIGIVGKDTILEEGRKLYEVMDLGFGKCKMCVCGPESAREVLENNQLIRVATKYPNIAKDYFFNRKHQTVDLKKLNGSIEMAPIGTACTIVATVDRTVQKQPRPRMQVTEVSLVDETGVLQVAFFRQPWIAQQFKRGDRLALMG